jgi:hypothetical protein
MTTGIQNKVSQVNSFVDESFDIKRLNDFKLVIVIGSDGMRLTVFDKSSNKYIAFEYYSFQNAFNPAIISDLLEAASKSSKVMSHRYKNVTCLVENNLSTLVPEALFEADRKKTYLKFNTELEGDELIMIDNIASLGAKNIFAVPFSIKAKADAMFSNVEYHHFSSPLIDGLMIQSKNIAKKQVFVHVQASHFEVLVIEGKKLLFYNSFNHHSAEDFMYYLLFVCEQLHLNPETQEMILLGEIERNSAIFNLVQKYVRNIKLGSRNENAEMSYQLQTFPRHFYFTLFNNYTV